MSPEGKELLQVCVELQDRAFLRHVKQQIESRRISLSPWKRFLRFLGLWKSKQTPFFIHCDFDPVDPVRFAMKENDNA
jgi:hypothetical protein